MKLIHFYFAFLFFYLNAAHANDLSFKSDHYKLEKGKSYVLATGNVVVKKDGQVVKADKIKLYQKRKYVEAEGNVKISFRGFEVETQKAKWDFKKESGELEDFVMLTANKFKITGQKLIKKNEKNFTLYKGSVSSCLECLQAWALHGERIDVEIGGYAKAYNALFLMFGFPALFSPYFVLPVKNKRQSGLLIPYYRFEPRFGHQWGVPYYFVLGEESEILSDYRYSTRAGHLVKTDFQYIKSQLDYIKSNKILSYQSKSTNYNQDFRFWFEGRQRWQISPNWTQNLKWAVPSDPFFSGEFRNDFAVDGFALLNNHLSFSRLGEKSYLDLSLQYYAQNLGRKSNLKQQSDSHFILPSVHFSFEDTWLLPELLNTFELDINSYRRFDGSYRDFKTNWIRNGERLSLKFDHQYIRQLGHGIRSKSSVQQKLGGYHFGLPLLKKTAARYRLQLEQSLETRFSRYYSAENGERMWRHRIVPNLSWSYEALDWRSKHDFFEQGFLPNPMANNKVSPQFDLHDPSLAEDLDYPFYSIVEELKLDSHHYLTMGIDNELLLRRGSKDRKYFDLLNFQFATLFDLDKNSFEYLFAESQFKYSYFDWQFSLAAHLPSNRVDFSSDFIFKLKWIHFFIDLEKLKNRESYLLGTSVFLGDFRLSSSLQYGAAFKSLIMQKYGLFYQSPSKCWLVGLELRKHPGSQTFEYFPSFFLSYQELGKVGQL